VTAVAWADRAAGVAVILGTLASVVATLVVPRGLRSRLAAAGPTRIAEGFRADQMVEAYLQLYRDVLREAGGHAAV